MAKVPALVDVLASLDDRGRPSVEHAVRLMREAGCITSGKRGFGSSDITARDAANALLGLFGTESLKDAPRASAQLQSLVIAEFWVAKPGQAQLFDALSNCRTLGEAVAFLIASAPQIRDAVNLLTADTHPDEAFGFDFWVDMPIRQHRARMRCQHLMGHADEDRCLLDIQFDIDPALAIQSFYDPIRGSGRNVTVAFGWPVFVQLWALVVGVDEDTLHSQLHYTRNYAPLVDAGRPRPSPAAEARSLRWGTSDAQRRSAG